MENAPELYGKLARLYVPETLHTGQTLTLAHDQAHYLRNVLRKNPNDTVRLFNAASGEFLARLTTLDKKGAIVMIDSQLRAPVLLSRRVHLLFAPIKKARMDFLMEKAVELGVTDLHPVMTHRTENRNLNESRLRAQITEAAEQCERMHIATLHPVQPLRNKIQNWDKKSPVFWARERADAPLLASMALSGDVSFLIGPEGGFDSAEIDYLQQFPVLQPISLGPAVLRAETAALLCLGLVLNKH
jgi:16S rRNA (uracil1498-N3)-methyltransferase